jgi:mRNA-degrading endonuclease HigB of HigAB toxin-antitoxin module
MSVLDTIPSMERVRGNRTSIWKLVCSILKGGRVVFNIKANDYRLIAVVRYENGVMMIRFFGSHEEYDQVDAETV